MLKLICIYRSQSAQDPIQPKIPVSPRSQSALDIVLNNLIIIIRTFESELLMKINQYVYQNFGGLLPCCLKGPFTLNSNFDWDLGLTGILS